MPSGEPQPRPACKVHLGQWRQNQTPEWLVLRPVGFFADLGWPVWTRAQSPPTWSGPGIQGRPDPSAATQRHVLKLSNLLLSSESPPPSEAADGLSSCPARLSGVTDWRTLQVLHALALTTVRESPGTLLLLPHCHLGQSRMSLTLCQTWRGSGLISSVSGRTPEGE